MFQAFSCVKATSTIAVFPLSSSCFFFSCCQFSNSSRLVFFSFPFTCGSPSCFLLNLLLYFSHTKTTAIKKSCICTPWNTSLIFTCNFSPSSEWVFFIKAIKGLPATTPVSLNSIYFNTAMVPAYQTSYQQNSGVSLFITPKMKVQ